MMNPSEYALEQVAAILAQLKNIQQTLNTCCYTLFVIAALLGYLATR